MARRANERLERHENGAAGPRRHMRVVGSEPTVCALTGQLVLRKEELAGLRWEDRRLSLAQHDHERQG